MRSRLRFHDDYGYCSTVYIPRVEPEADAQQTLMVDAGVNADANEYGDSDQAADSKTHTFLLT